MLCLWCCFHDQLIVFNTIKDWVVSLKWLTVGFYITVKKVEPTCRKYTKFDSKAMLKMTYLASQGNRLLIILFLRFFKIIFSYIYSFLSINKTVNLQVFQWLEQFFGCGKRSVSTDGLS